VGILNRHHAVGRVLEIGAGNGVFLREARAAGWDASALEADPVQAGRIRENLGIPCETRTDAFADQTFDAVYHRNVLSHLDDPVQAFHQVHARLAPGGVHVFETGNFADLDADAHDLVRRTEGYQLPVHLAFFGERSVRILLEKTGFDLVSLRVYPRTLEKRWPGRVGWHFALTYRLGTVLPTAGRPCAIVVVAKRR